MSDHPQRRRGARTIVDWPAVLLRGGARLPCAIVDISRGGAKLAMPNEIPARAYVVLLSEKFGSLEGYVAWRNGHRAGIAFTDPTAAAALQPYLKTAADEPVAVTVKFGRRRPVAGR